MCLIEWPGRFVSPKENERSGTQLWLGLHSRFQDEGSGTQVSGRGVRDTGFWTKGQRHRQGLTRPTLPVLGRGVRDIGFRTRGQGHRFQDEGSGAQVSGRGIGDTGFRTRGQGHRFEDEGSGAQTGVD